MAVGVGTRPAVLVIAGSLPPFPPLNARSPLNHVHFAPVSMASAARAGTQHVLIPVSTISTGGHPRPRPLVQSPDSDPAQPVNSTVRLRRFALTC